MTQYIGIYMFSEKSSIALTAFPRFESRIWQKKFKSAQYCEPFISELIHLKPPYC